MKRSLPIRIVGGIVGIPMLAVAIVALFWGSMQALMLGLALGAASLYLICAAVHGVGSRPSKAVPVATRPGVAARILRIGLTGFVGFAGFMWAIASVSHKCSAGSRIVESYAPLAFMLLCAGMLFFCRRYTVSFLMIAILFVLALLGGFYYKEAVHRGAPEEIGEPPLNMRIDSDPTASGI